MEARHQVVVMVKEREVISGILLLRDVLTLMGAFTKDIATPIRLTLHPLNLIKTKAYLHNEGCHIGFHCAN